MNQVFINKLSVYETRDSKENYLLKSAKKHSCKKKGCLSEAEEFRVKKYVIAELVNIISTQFTNDAK